MECFEVDPWTTIAASPLREEAASSPKPVVYSDADQYSNDQYNDSVQPLSPRSPIPQQELGQYVIFNNPQDYFATPASPDEVRTSEKIDEKEEEDEVATVTEVIEEVTRNTARTVDPKTWKYSDGESIDFGEEVSSADSSTQGMPNDDTPTTPDDVAKYLKEMEAEEEEEDDETEDELPVQEKKAEEMQVETQNMFEPQGQPWDWVGELPLNQTEYFEAIYHKNGLAYQEYLEELQMQGDGTVPIVEEIENLSSIDDASTDSNGIFAEIWK
jgi:hypothetical protein